MSAKVAEIRVFQSFSDLTAAFPWTTALLLLPSEPATVIFSEARDGHDVDRCCSALVTLLERRSKDLGEGIYVLSGRRVWPGSNIVLRRRGHWQADMNPDSIKHFRWIKEASVTLPDSPLACAAGLLANSVTLSLASFAIRYPAAIVIGQLEENRAQQWLENNAAQIWISDDARVEVRIAVTECLSRFPSSSRVAVVCYGGDDFGGIYFFCVGLPADK